MPKAILREDTCYVFLTNILCADKEKELARPIRNMGQKEYESG